MNDYLKMDDCVELEEYATKNIGENCSFKALNARGEIIGVAMNGIIKKPVSVNFIMKIAIEFCNEQAIKVSASKENEVKRYDFCNSRVRMSHITAMQPNASMNNSKKSSASWNILMNVSVCSICIQL